MATVYLGLGSNLGNRQLNLQRAIRLLNENSIITEKISSFVETNPVGGPKQNKFINAVVKAQTEHSPQKLLILVKSIEKRIGRLPLILNGPRVIDIDILLYNSLKLESPQLIIPHPRMTNRHFVLRPLEEIAPELFKAGKFFLPKQIKSLTELKI